MPENIRAWWSRRQRSKGSAVPYPIGTFRPDWQRYPALIKQYHPDLNGMITLSQIPPAADVFLTWQCEVGHVFVATPEEQRNRPGRTRRRSAWCPDCAMEAEPPRIRTEPRVPGVASTPRRARRIEPVELAVGEAFVSASAPKPASAAEADLRQRIGSRFEFDLTMNAVRVRQPFFDRLEVWPDIPIAELRIAIEYDTVGRHGLEHVGSREAIDRRKDRLLRHSGWEVVRVRCGKLQPLGPFDVLASGVTSTVVDRVIDRFREISGDLFVEAYRR
jgi:very-short-patch-repair endonuclease